MEADENGRPIAVCLPAGRQGVSGRRYNVEAVLDTWRIDDEWWRAQPVSRMYYSLLLEDEAHSATAWAGSPESPAPAR